MRQIKIKDTIIGDEKVKICMPVSPRDFSELEAEFEHAFNSPCDVVELRFDYLAELICKIGGIFNTQSKVKSDKLILFTYRTQAEGGLGTDNDDKYYTINEQAILSGQIDILDVEFTKDKSLVERIIKLAHENDVKVIISKHYFEKSLSQDEQIEMLIKMQATGADIVKLATTVFDKKGAQDVISAAKEMYENHAKVPFITIGMGEFGKITRFIEPFYGSAMTYAKGLKSTAPGQMSILELLGEV